MRLIFMLNFLVLFSLANLYSQEKDKALEQAVERSNINKKDNISIPGNWVIKLYKDKLDIKKLDLVKKQFANKSLSINEISKISKELKIADDIVQSSISKLKDKYNLISKLKNITPIALSIHKNKSILNNLKKEEEKVTQDYLKSRLQKKIEQQSLKLNTLELSLKALTKDIQRNQLIYLDEYLIDAGIKADKINVLETIIRGYSIRISGNTVLEGIKAKLNPDKIQEAEEKLKDKEFIINDLHPIFKELGLDSNALVNEFYANQNFIDNLTKIVPITIRIDAVKKEIKKLNEELEKTKSEKVVKEIKNKIAVQEKQLKNAENLLDDKALDYKENQLEGLADVLSKAKFQSDTIQIAETAIKNLIDFRKTTNTLLSTINSIEQLKLDIKNQEAELKKAKTDQDKITSSKKLTELRNRLNELEKNYSILITGINPEDLLKEKEKKKIQWDDELQDIFSPIIVELRDATERPRQIELLNSKIAYYEKRIEQIQHAIENIKKIKNNVRNKELYAKLSDSEHLWVNHSKEYFSKLQTTQHQLAELEKSKKSFSEIIKTVYKVLFEERGKNIILSILIFLAVFTAFMGLRILYNRYDPFKENSRYFFVSNLVKVLLYLLSFIASTFAAVFYLFLSNDWLILGIAIILLLGLVWTLRNTLPVILGQIKILLGLGAVRQGERVEYNSVLYRVDSIGIYCYLHNPLLTGGTIRLPIKNLLDMVSRPYDESEPWFPTRLKDWVILSDNVYGEIVVQNPDNVIVSTVRGSYQTYSTESFLKHNPRNLSINTFAVNRVIPLDFSHRPIILSEVERNLKPVVEEFIKKQFYGEHLLKVFVELKEVNRSALNLIIIGRFNGACASEYTEIGWVLAQAGIDGANKFGLKIAYDQIALHQGNETNNPII